MDGPGQEGHGDGIAQSGRHEPLRRLASATIAHTSKAEKAHHRQEARRDPRYLLAAGAGAATAVGNGRVSRSWQTAEYIPPLAFQMT